MLANILDEKIVLEAYYKMLLAKHMANCYENNRSICKYVHSTSRGHEAVQLALALQLLPCDFVSPYYRDESIMLGLGFTPYELILQLLAKANDPFSGGRSYYNHPSYKGADKPTIIHQSSATGMQVIPTTGIAQGIKYKENYLSDKLIKTNNHLPIAICSLGDASVTEGEVSEGWQFAALHQLPILYLVQDNDWGISVTSNEARSMNALEYAKGFKGIETFYIEEGHDFINCYVTINTILNKLRTERKPIVLQVKVPLLGHHTSGVRKEFYRTTEEVLLSEKRDPIIHLQQFLLKMNINESNLQEIENKAKNEVAESFEKAKNAKDPLEKNVNDHIFAPTTITTEKGKRNGGKPEKIMMVDAALFAIREIMEADDTVVLYGQDVGKRLGGVFRETASLGQQFGEHRVFNTAIQEAYIIGSTAGMCAVGLKPIVEIQFADYLYPGLNQLVTELSKSCYLTMGKFPIQTLIRVPIGAYGGGGPYHSGSIENLLLTCKGIKIVYPSNAADMKGLMKAAFYDPNPVIMLEHKGLYWSKVPGTDMAKMPEPDNEYIIPLGKALVVKDIEKTILENENCLTIITYGMGVHWALNASHDFNNIIIVDLRTLEPLDEACIIENVLKTGRCIIVTESQKTNSFAEALSGKIATQCFSKLDAPIQVLGAMDLPAVPININLEAEMLPNTQKLKSLINQLLSY